MNIDKVADETISAMKTLRERLSSLKFESAFQRKVLINQSMNQLMNNRATDVSPKLNVRFDRIRSKLIYPDPLKKIKTKNQGNQIRNMSQEWILLVSGLNNPGLSIQVGGRLLQLTSRFILLKQEISSMLIRL